MDAAIERRTNGVPRVPLDALIELSHRDFEETFEADAVNLGLGGISMRASFLPELGTKLDFRFRTQEGTAVRATGEVVWAEDGGPYLGEFGLRFVDINPDVRDVVRDLVYAFQEDAYSEDEGTDPGLPPEHLDESLRERRTRPISAPTDASSSAVTLYLDGVATPIAAQVMHYEKGVTQVEQELPFLRIGTPVTEGREGVRGRLESIDLRLDGGTPRLVMGVAWEPKLVTEEPLIEVPYLSAGEPVDASVDAAAAEAPLDHPLDTVTDLRGPSVPAVIAGYDPADDFPDASAWQEPSDPGQYLPEASEPGFDVSEHQEPGLLRDSSIDREAVHRDTPRPVVQREAIDHASLPTSDAEEMSSDDIQALSEMRGETTGVGRAVQAAMRIKAKAAPRVAELKARASDGLKNVRTRTMPTLLKVWAVVRAFAVKLGRRAKPLFLRGLASTQRFFRRIVQTVRRARSGKPRRRTTSPAPGRRRQRAAGPQVMRSTSRRQAKQSQPKNRRIALYAVGLLLVVGLTAYALYPSGESSEGEVIASDEAEAPAVRIVESAAPANDDVGSTGGVYLDDVRGAVQPARRPAAPARPAPEPEAVPVPDVEPRVPTAMSEPSREAGQIPATGFPSLASSPSVVPAGSPYAVDVRESATEAVVEHAAEPDAPLVASRSFGASSVNNARAYSIQMSLPIQSISGERIENGFRVRIPGALALEPAGPIAANNDDVASSAIRNFQDHAVLTLTFDGEVPAYRVAARGQTLEIQLAR